MKIRVKSITNQRNMAAEVVKKFPEDSENPPLLHVPMRDAFSNEKVWMGKVRNPLKIDGWKMKFPFEMVPFQGTC